MTPDLTDQQETVAVGDLYTAGPNPGRLVVDYASAAAASETNGREREPFTQHADGTLSIKRGRPRKGRKTLRDYGLTKQRLYLARLLAQIPEAELNEYWRTHRPSATGTLRHFGLLPPLRRRSPVE